MKNNMSLADLENRLVVLDKQIKENYQKQNTLQEEAGMLTEEDVRLRSEIIFRKKLLCTRPWRYESTSRLDGRLGDFPGLCEALGRHYDYHASLMLDEWIKLVLSDGDIYICINPPPLAKGEKPFVRGTAEYAEYTKEKMQTFVRKWGIVIDSKHLEERLAQIQVEAAQAEALLAECKAITG